MVDSRVRVQSSPSPVEHQKLIIRLNQWSTLFKNKYKKIYSISHTTLPLFLSHLHRFQFTTNMQMLVESKMEPVMIKNYPYHGAIE